MVEHAHHVEYTRKEIVCESCQRILTTRPAVPRTVGTMIGSIRLERPYFYCRVCKEGTYPLDEALGLTPGRNQLDVQQAAAKLVIETSYDEAQVIALSFPLIYVDERLKGGFTIELIGVHGAWAT